MVWAQKETSLRLSTSSPNPALATKNTLSVPIMFTAAIGTLKMRRAISTNGVRPATAPWPART